MMSHSRYSSEVQCSNEWGRTCIVADLPWLPRRPRIAKLPETEFYKRFIANGCGAENENRKISIIRAFARAFPFFLPVRYHTMDSFKIFHCSEMPGDYWLNVGHFLTITSDWATIPFYNLMHGEAFLKEPKGFLNDEWKDTAADFLLEPWVLLQLPFQPALLHQWAVAALAETLRYCKRLVKISSRGYAPQFHDLYTELAKLSQILFKNCNALLANFFTIYCKAPTENIHTKARKMYPEYPELLAETLAALEFILSTDCTEMLNCIMRKSWTKSISPEALHFSTDPLEIGCFDLKLERRSTVYSDLYWTQGTQFTRLYSKLDKTSDSRMDMINAESKSYVLKNHPDLRDNPKKFISLLEAGGHIEKLFGSPLKELKNKDEFVYKLESLMGNEDFAQFQQEALNFLSHAGVDRDSPGVALGGIIHRILSLQADVFLVRSMGVMRRLVWRAAKKFDKEVYLEAENIPIPPEFSLQIFEQSVKSVVARREKWTLESVLSKARASCEMINPDDESNNETFMQVYRVRIRSFVLRMYEKQYETLREGPFHFYPECHFAQYIVPCFVATLMEIMHTQSINASVKDKTERDYFEFVRCFIACYERYPLLQVLRVPQRKRLLYSDQENSGRKFREILRFFSHIFQFSEALQKVVGKMQHVQEHCRDWIAPRHQQDLKLFAPTNVEMQLHWLCCRLLVCFANSSYSPTITHKFFPQNPTVIWALEFVTGESTVLLNMIKLKHCPQRESLAFRFFSRKLQSQASKGVIRDAKRFNDFQMYRLAVFESVLAQVDPEKFFTVHQECSEVFDEFYNTASHAVRNEWLQLKKDVQPYLMGNLSEDRSLIHIEEAKKNLLCRPLLKYLNSARKFEAPSPAIAAFFPIQHCRRCGLVHCSEFRLCIECKDEPTYPDPNYFCSEKCESEALAAGHIEEHATFIVNVKLGLDAIGLGLNEPTENLKI